MMIIIGFWADFLLQFLLFCHVMFSFDHSVHINLWSRPFSR